MRILLTRAQLDAEKTAKKLLSLGFTPVIVPLANVLSLAPPLPAGRFDAVVASSAHAFAGIALGAITDFPLYCVGARTAEAGLKAGFRTIGDVAGTAELLAERVIERLPKAANVLFLAGVTRKPVLEEKLASAGFAVSICETYAIKRQENRLKAAIFGQIDAALHYSRSSAQRFSDAVQACGAVEAVRGVPHLVLSDDVAAGLADLQPLRILIAARPDEAALLDLLAICRS